MTYGRTYERRRQKHTSSRRASVDATECLVNMASSSFFSAARAATGGYSWARHEPKKGRKYKQRKGQYARHNRQSLTVDENDSAPRPMK
jgi:hypothetical protein